MTKSSFLMCLMMMVMAGVSGANELTMFLAPKSSLVHGRQSKLSAQQLTELSADLVGFPTASSSSSSSDMAADLFQHADFFLHLVLEKNPADQPINFPVFQDQIGSPMTFELPNQERDEDKIEKNLPVTLATHFDQTKHSLFNIGHKSALIKSLQEKIPLLSANSKFDGFTDLTKQENVDFVDELHQIDSLINVLQNKPTKKKIYMVLSLTSLNQFTEAAVYKKAQALLNEKISQLLKATNSAKRKVVQMYSVPMGYTAESNDDMIMIDGVMQFNRQLAETNSSNTTKPDAAFSYFMKTGDQPLTQSDIETFQIVLWVSVLLAFFVYLAIYALCTMNIGRDSLLYAKFQTEAKNRKID